MIPCSITRAAPDCSPCRCSHAASSSGCHASTFVHGSSAMGSGVAPSFSRRRTAGSSSARFISSSWTRAVRACTASSSSVRRSRTSHWTCWTASSMVSSEEGTTVDARRRSSSDVTTDIMEARRSDAASLELITDGVVRLYSCDNGRSEAADSAPSIRAGFGVSERHTESAAEDGGSGEDAWETGMTAVRSKSPLTMVIDGFEIVRMGGATSCAKSLTTVSFNSGAEFSRTGGANACTTPTARPPRGEGTRTDGPMHAGDDSRPVLSVLGDAVRACGRKAESAGEVPASENAPELRLLGGDPRHVGERLLGRAVAECSSERKRATRFATVGGASSLSLPLGDELMFDENEFSRRLSDPSSLSLRFSKSLRVTRRINVEGQRGAANELHQESSENTDRQWVGVWLWA
eukprot:m.40655 g.40655  ORF g.40655 m.40655 type:complete len:406 (-) comp5624_c0_seq3:57-1274(-)